MRTLLSVFDNVTAARRTGLLVRSLTTVPDNTAVPFAAVAPLSRAGVCSAESVLAHNTKPPISNHCMEAISGHLSS